MKVYCTKYLFTSGIQEIEVEQSCFYLYGQGKEWHKTKESAIARAEEMRIKKLKALDKQMKKISAMKFEL